MEILDFKEYEKFTESTDISNQSIQFYLDGISEEGGELSGIFKRIRRGDFGDHAKYDIEDPDKGLEYVIRHYPEIKKAIVSEIGDRHWYTTRLLTKIKVGWNDVMEYNKAKLEERKKDNTIMGHGEERVPSGDDSMPVSLDRYEFLDIFSDFLEKEGFSSYGHAEKKGLEQYCDEFGRFKNQIFEMSAFWWGDCTCGAEPGTIEMYSGPKAHKKDCIVYIGNFHYKPTNIKIDWYKYPFRSMTANREFTDDEFRTAMRDCKESLKDII